jgi:hypothetical protein
MLDAPRQPVELLHEQQVVRAGARCRDGLSKAGADVAPTADRDVAVDGHDAPLRLVGSYEVPQGGVLTVGCGRLVSAGVERDVGRCRGGGFADVGRPRGGGRRSW